MGPWAKHGQRSAARFEPFSADSRSGRLVHLAKANRTNVGARRRGDSVNRDATVNHPVIVANDLCDGRSVIKDSCHFMAPKDVTGEPVIAEVPNGNEAVATGGDAEIEIESDGAAQITKPKAGPEAGDRRQRRPATIIT